MIQPPQMIHPPQRTRPTTLRLLALTERGDLWIFCPSTTHWLHTYNPQNLVARREIYLLYWPTKLLGHHKIYLLYYFSGVATNSFPVRTSHSQTTFEPRNFSGNDDSDVGDDNHGDGGGNDDSNGDFVPETQLDDGAVEADDVEERAMDDGNKRKSHPQPHSNRGAAAENDRSKRAKSTREIKNAIG